MSLPKTSELYEDPLRRPSRGYRGPHVRSMRVRHGRSVSVPLEEHPIEWSNLIFLPFHPVFRMIVVAIVFIKAMMGPIQSVYPIVYCNDLMNHHPVLMSIKYFYWYCCDSIYATDTFLHMVHRQVVDKAMRREHLPKSAKWLVCDLVSLIPFFRLIMSDPCLPPRIWPNILLFNEFLVTYRVIEYFSMGTSHSYPMLLLGHAIVMCLCINCVACFFLLVTNQGFCERCNDPNVFFDWRSFIWLKFNETVADKGYAAYVCGAVFVYSFAINERFEELMPSAILEFIMVCILMVVAYVTTNFIILPKAIHESILRFRRICDVYSRVKKVTQETKRRNPDGNSDELVETYYKLLWRKRSGIATKPPFVDSLPRYLRLYLKQDLIWPLFHHSPTLRKTSYPFRRWLTELTVLSYKLPGEKFFTGPHAKGSLYYLKSGIVQLISVDDGVTPILSVTSGTILGDINFFVPPFRRKVIARCLTFCEYYFVKRQSMIKSLQKYPSDRKIIMDDVIKRLKHAKILFANKQQLRGCNINEDEGICWLKKRWWEIFNIIENYTKTTGNPKEALKGKLPPDEASYHCSKYIGQLVLCNKTELRTKSMFTNFKFPWIINPHSQFGLVWYRIVAVDVFLVLILYPQYLIKPHIPVWFEFFTFCSDTIYTMDIGVSLVTAVKKQYSVTNTFPTVMFERFKSITFILDLLSTIWIEDIVELCGAKRYYYTLQFNRLIKMYVLFYGEYLKFDSRKDPMLNVCRVIALIQFAFFIVSSNVVFEMLYYFPELSMSYFFGEKLCSKALEEGCTPTPIFGAAVSWAFEWTCHALNPPETLEDLYVACSLGYVCFIINVFCKGRFISYLYLVNKNQIKYQSFVLQLKAYYQHYRIHTDLLKRLDGYLTCHWKYYKGTDVLEPHKVDNEAREIFWKAQGNLAESIIAKSKVFRYADPNFIRDLARATYLLILPRNTDILMFGVQSKYVTWVVQGNVKGEYVNEKGEMFTNYLGPGSIMSICEVFLGKVSLRSYTSITECEIMFIKVNDFFASYKKYPIEYAFVQTCIEESRDMFEEIFKKKILKHRDYLSRLKEMADEFIRGKIPLKSKITEDIEANRSFPVEGLLWGEPRSRFMEYWMLFRVVIVCVSIASASILGIYSTLISHYISPELLRAAKDRNKWKALEEAFVESQAVTRGDQPNAELPYYDHRGVYITDKGKCLQNYLTKGFTLDIIGAAPWCCILKTLLYRNISDDVCFLINTVFKFAHLYIVFAYFGYITDIPTVNMANVMILKWQIVNILVLLGTSHYLMINCVHFQFNEMKDLVGISRRNSCWMPTLFDLPKTLNVYQLHLVFAESLSLAQNGMMRMSVGRFTIDRSYLGVGMILFTLGLVSWFISCYTLTLMVLRGRGDTVFQHSVCQLERFLKSERVEKEVIDKVLEHFRYCWLRTKGLNLDRLANARIGVMFRQDLSYYFYKKTLTILDSIIGGGETMQRQLAGVSDVAYFLPGHDIFREMDIVSNVYIVQRGRVNVFRDGKQIIILTKGDIFGQLEGVKLRPIRVTVTADGHVDLLHISVAAFQNTITDEMRASIRRSRQAQNDFMAARDIFIENPYDSVQYLLRGCKTIHLPWCRKPLEAYKNSWYLRWLYLAWLIGPFVSSCLVLIFIFVPLNSTLWLRLYCAIFITDAIDLANFIAEFYTIELIVVNDKCTLRRLGMKKFKDWGFYMDALSLLIPLITILTDDWTFQTARLLRLKFFIDFQYYFCRSFRSQKAIYLLKIAIILLLLHLFTCGWILFACKDEKFPINITDTSHLNTSIDFSQWMQPKNRKGGCARSTKPIVGDNGVKNPSFVVPRFWGHDYVVAMTYILLIHTYTHSLETVIAVSLKQMYYQVFVTYCMYLLDMWIIAVAINLAMNKYRVFYQYAYNVQTMANYWRDNGIGKSLIEIVQSYTDHVWKRQKGDWLPELAYQGPQCLRQDLFTALYVHHLDAAPTFRQLPDYFKRQLCARFYRVVIFPGKCIVREGDIFTTTYFIHEGEVEKWCTDSSGEGHLMSVLYTNGYFGCVSGLFPNASFRYSYYTRTVVDLMYLSLNKWEDLLESYPEVKTKLYDVTARLMKDANVSKPSDLSSMGTTSSQASLCA